MRYSSVSALILALDELFAVLLDIITTVTLVEEEEKRVEDLACLFLLQILKNNVKLQREQMLYSIWQGLTPGNEFNPCPFILQVQ